MLFAQVYCMYIIKQVHHIIIMARHPCTRRAWCILRVFHLFFFSVCRALST